MTTDSVTTRIRPERLEPAALYRAAARAARRRYLRRLLVAGAWFWVIWAAFVAGVPLIVDRWGGEMDGLTYDAAGGPARWVGFAVGTIVTAGQLKLHVAAGGTRRALVDGAARAAAVAGLAYGVLAVLLAFGEERVYSALDRYWQGPATPLALDSSAGIVVDVLAEALVVVTYSLVGMAVVAGFLRSGPWGGTLLVVPLLVPAALADLATGTGIAGLPLRGGLDDPALGATLALVGGLAAAALAAVVAHRMLRHVRIRP